MFEKERKKLFISIPMDGKSSEQIIAEQEKILEEVKGKTGEDVALLQSCIKFTDDKSIIKNVPVWYLGKSLEILSKADYIYFAQGWEKSRGCNIERMVAERYGIHIFNE